MNDTLLVALVAGLALSVAAFAVWRLVVELGSAETIYRDRPPSGFRWLWPAVNIFANTFGFLLRGEREAAMLARLRKAGQEYALTPHQFFGGKIVGAALGALVGFILSGDGGALLGVVLGGLFGFVYPDIWLSDHTKKRNLAILKAMPFFLDIVTLSIEAGLNLTGALQKAVDKCKAGPLMVEINRVLRDVRAGRPRVEALRELGLEKGFGPPRRGDRRDGDRHDRDWRGAGGDQHPH